MREVKKRGIDLGEKCAGRCGDAGKRLAFVRPAINPLGQRLPVPRNNNRKTLV